MAIPSEMIETFKVVDASGTHDVQVSLLDYNEAGSKGLSLSQYLSAKYPTSGEHGTAFEQFCMQAGIRVRADNARGIPASNMYEIINGIQTSAGPLVRNDGSDRHSIAGRLLYPEVIMQIINSGLIASKEDYLTPWESAIALKTSVVQARVDQPTITVTAPRDSAAQPISQMALPATMISISLGSRQYAIPTKSIGVEIADQALQSTTIDRLGITLTQQAIGERIRRIEADMANIISGDTDFGIAAVSAVNASTFDSTIPGTHKMTQKAYVKWLRANYQKMSITHMLLDIDTALDIEARYGRPLAVNDTSNQPYIIDAKYSIANLGLPNPQMLLLPTAIVGANTIIGFDKNFALHEITNVSASYSAVEQFVMRRVTAMRFDFGIALFKLQDEAFTGLVIGA